MCNMLICTHTPTCPPFPTLQTSRENEPWGPSLAGHCNCSQWQCWAGSGHRAIITLFLRATRTLLWLSGNCHKAGRDPNEAGAPEKKGRQAGATRVHQLSDGSSSRTNVSPGSYGKSRPASRGRVTVLQQTGCQNSPQGPRCHLLRPGTSHCRRSGLGPPCGLTGRWVFRCLQMTRAATQQQPG